MDGDVSEVLPAVRAPTLILHRDESRASRVRRGARAGARRIEVEGLHDSSAGRTRGATRPAPRDARFVEGPLHAPRARIASSRLSSSRTSWARRSGQQSSATPPGASCLRSTTRSCAASSCASEARSSTPPATDSSPRSTGRGGRSSARLRSARRCALSSLEIRAGLHTGECERVDGKLGGIAVPTGARIARSRSRVRYSSRRP